MKKLMAMFICIFMIFLLLSCSNSPSRQDKVASIFDSFENPQNYILLTKHQLVVKDVHYDLSEIKHNGKQCHIVFLEEEGFYSYTCDRETLSVEFLFTCYEGFETLSLGADILPNEIINDFFGENCFWFRMDDPETEEFKQIYYAWCIDTQQSRIVSSDDVTRIYEYAEDNNRSKNYTFAYDSNLLNSFLEVTDNNTDVTKRIDKSVLNTFDEGKKIKRANGTTFNIDHVFEQDGNIYFASYFHVQTLGNPSYYYIVKWNFETESCDYFTSVYFEEYQDWIEDIYIL